MQKETPSSQELESLHHNLLQQGFIRSDQTIAFSMRHHMDGMVVVSGMEPCTVQEISFAKIDQTADQMREMRWHAAIYRRHRDIDTIIHSQAACTHTISKVGRSLLPLLDDFAQIIGPHARCVNPLLPQSEGAIGKALKRRGAVILQNHGALCVGGGMEDAFAAAYVCEKNAKALIETAFLGGSWYLSRFDSYLMHGYYRFKYSKRKK